MEQRRGWKLQWRDLPPLPPRLCTVQYSAVLDRAVSSFNMFPLLGFHLIALPLERLTLVKPNACVGGSVSLPLNGWHWSAFPNLANLSHPNPQLIPTLQVSVMLGPSLAGATGSRMIESGGKSTQRFAPALNIGGPDT